MDQIITLEHWKQTWPGMTDHVAETTLKIHNFLRMREKLIEAGIIKMVEGLNGWAPKWVSPAYSGVPDRIVLLPGGKVGFIEAKAPGGRATALQLHAHAKLRALGFKVFIVENEAQCKKALDEIRSA